MRPKRDKLSLADAINIRVRVRRGEATTQLAEEYGVTAGTITAVVQRRTHSVSDITTELRGRLGQKLHGGRVKES